MNGGAFSCYGPLTYVQEWSTEMSKAFSYLRCYCYLVFLDLLIKRFRKPREVRVTVPALSSWSISYKLTCTVKEIPSNSLPEEDRKHCWKGVARSFFFWFKGVLIFTHGNVVAFIRADVSPYVLPCDKELPWYYKSGIFCPKLWYTTLPKYTII